MLSYQRPLPLTLAVMAGPVPAHPRLARLRPEKSWMAGTSPLLSGTSVAYQQMELSGRLLWPWLPLLARIEQVSEGAADEEVGAHEEQDVAGGTWRLLAVLGEAHQQVGDERDGDLGADGVLGGAGEAADPEVLLDPLEEQLDLPALLVEGGDLLGRAVEVVGEQAQQLAAVDADGDGAALALERIAPAAGEAAGQVAGLIGEHAGVGGDRPGHGRAQRRVGLEPGDEAAAGGGEAGPPAEVIVAEVEDVGRAGFDRQQALGGGVVVEA